MRIAENPERGKRAVLAAVDAGYTLFDHADIYADGKCEELFGEVLRESPGLRERILIQGKCSIRLATENVPETNVLIVGATPLAETFLRAAEEFAPEHVRIIGVLGLSDRQVGRQLAGQPILGRPETVRDVLAELEL